MSSDKIIAASDVDQGVVLEPMLSQDPDWLNVSLVGLRQRLSLRCGVDAVGAVGDALGVELPRRIGRSLGTPDGGAARPGNEICILCLGPDEWLLLAPPDHAGQVNAALNAAATKAVFASVDVSHRNVAFSVSGQAAAALMNGGCPLDFSVGAFGVGRCTRTVYEHTEIIIQRTAEEAFHVETWRSFAPYLTTYFAAVARALRSER